MRVYRICRDCGKDWNVSKIDPGGKAYICPTCEFRNRAREKEKAAKVLQHQDGKKGVFI